jgi:hypothetical protein
MEQVSMEASKDAIGSKESWLLSMVVLLLVKIIRCLKSSMLPRVMRPLKDPDSQGGETVVYQGSPLL